MQDQGQPRVWQRMQSGCQLDLIAPSQDAIQSEDIALGLSRQHRWNGQTAGEFGYSVAQHSVMVANLLEADKLPFDAQDPERWRRAALLHDAAEYVCSDLISPLKNVVGDVFRTVENRLMQAIHLRFGLPEELPKDVKLAIKAADIQACVTEAVCLAGFERHELEEIFATQVEPIADQLDVWSEDKARAAFQAALIRYSPTWGLS